MSTETASVAAISANPLLAEWEGPHQFPAFDRYQAEDFVPAFDHALAEHRREIDAIIADPAAPTFANTVEAFERGGQTLERVASVFYVLAGSHTNDAIQAAERVLAPKLAEFYNKVYTDARLSARFDTLYQARETLGLNAEQQRVLERYKLHFRRAGAQLDEAGKKRIGEISQRLAALGTQFGQNVLADEQDFTLVLDEEDDLAGLPPFLRAAAQNAAQSRGADGKYVITLARSDVDPFLQFSARRDLREKLFAAWTSRGEHAGEHDNTALISEMIALRDERAKLLGYPTFAHFKLDDTMAKTPEAVTALLDEVWAPARKRVLGDRDALQNLVQQEGGNFHLAPWDWRHYAEKLRKARYDLDEAEIKPYLQLENMIEAAFYTANRLFGLTFHPLEDCPGYHPDVRVWEVRGRDGKEVGLFLGDYFARPSKRSGAWMTSLRDQHRLDGEVKPIIVNVMNFTKAPEGEPSLLSYDDTRTLFHEFGHGLHGLLSNVTYPSLSGTKVFTDFVELPSQLYEHWAEQPQVLKMFARHYKTGEPMPDALLQRLLAARNFNRAFETTEYLGCAYVDLDFHQHPQPQAVDARAVEEGTRKRMGMPEEITLRHRPPHFQHIFSGGGYAAGYYSYMWSEVLDADAFRAFEEAGDIFDPETAQRLHDHIYSSGGTKDPRDAYMAFRGKMPSAQALLQRRGLA